MSERAVVQSYFGYLGENSSSSNNEVVVSGTGSLLRIEQGFQIGYLGRGNRLVGVVPALRMADALESQPDARIESILLPEPIHAHPDHTLDVVLERTLESGGLLPVVSRDDATRVLGVVTMADITRRIRSGRGSAEQRS